jgi:GAF domain-containing protein
VFNGAGDLIAVFDVDSDHKAMFDEADRAGIETILRDCFARAQ